MIRNCSDTIMLIVSQLSILSSKLSLWQSMQSNIQRSAEDTRWRQWYDHLCEGYIQSSCKDFQTISKTNYEDIAFPDDRALSWLNDVTLWDMPYFNVSCFYMLLRMYILKRSILGATLEWAELVRSDKRTQKHPKPTVAGPSMRVHTSTTPSTTCHYFQYMIPNLPRSQITDSLPMAKAVILKCKW